MLPSRPLTTSATHRELLMLGTCAVSSGTETDEGVPAIAADGIVGAFAAAPVVRRWRAWA